VQNAFGQISPPIPYVVVKFDYNMDKQESSQEAKQGSAVELNWPGSATDDEDNVSIECGYESVD